MVNAPVVTSTVQENTYLDFTIPTPTSTSTASVAETPRPARAPQSSSKGGGPAYDAGYRWCERGQHYLRTKCQHKIFCHGKPVRWVPKYKHKKRPLAQFLTKRTDHLVVARSHRPFAYGLPLVPEGEKT